MTNYPLGDFLIQIKNAAMANKKQVELLNSKLIESVALVLKKEKVLSEVVVKEGKITVKLAQHMKEPVLMDLKLMSKPGLRRYMSIDDLVARPRKNVSFIILSTPKGILSSHSAMKEKVGGEAIAEIW